MQARWMEVVLALIEVAQRRTAAAVSEADTVGIADHDYPAPLLPTIRFLRRHRRAAASFLCVQLALAPQVLLDCMP